MIDHGVRSAATERLESLGLEVSFGVHVEERDAFWSSSIESRLADLHAAFSDESVDAILTVIGGFNSNQLLGGVQWQVVADNPKILCGYSDITALSCAIHARTGLVTYSGPHFSTFGMRHHLDQTLDWFKAALFTDAAMVVEPSNGWSDDLWFLDQENRTVLPNAGPRIVQAGEASGTLVGGNLCTLNLLQGTPYMPSLADVLLFIEDDYESQPHHFDRNLMSLLQQPGGDRLAAVLIGRFQRDSHMTPELLDHIITTKPELAGVPVVADLDFGHTSPLLTIPVGGTATVSAVPGQLPRLVIHSRGANDTASTIR